MFVLFLIIYICYLFKLAGDVMDSENDYTATYRSVLLLHTTFAS